MRHALLLRSSALARCIATPSSAMRLRASTPRTLRLSGSPACSPSLLQRAVPRRGVFGSANGSWVGASAASQQGRRLVATSSAAAEALPATAAAAGEQAPALQLYNTMTRQKETFTTRPESPNNVQMYVCGVTVYDYSHIGHARVYVAFDVLYRLLLRLRYEVQYVRNFTDIDDKIIARASEAGEDPLALSRRFIDEFRVDMEALGCLPPTAEPKATDHIPQMIDAIQRIIQHGHGYAVGGDVFFDVGSLPGYGQLSGRSQEDNRAGERVAVDGRKRGAADFALWKSTKPGEPSWESPWGPGRPGWHIECSAMIEALMGNTIDIHGGGRDLIFPHHENEIAQSRAAAAPCSCGADHSQPPSSSTPSTSAPFVRYWVHNGFVNVDSEKMSKSLGNFFTIREVLVKYHPLALRWFLVGTHYRAPVNYTRRALEEASDRLYYVYQTLADIGDALSSADADEVRRAEAEAGQVATSGRGQGGQLVSSCSAALLDDLNTPMAVSELSAPLKAANDLLHTKAGRKQKDRVAQLVALRAGITEVLLMLGLAGGAEEVAGVLEGLRRVALVRAGVSEEEVQDAIGRRAEARKAKDFAAADGIRVELAAKGVMIMDTPQGTVWRPGLPADLD